MYDAQRWYELTNCLFVICQLSVVGERGGLGLGWSWVWAGSACWGPVVNSEI